MRNSQTFVTLETLGNQILMFFPVLSFHMTDPAPAVRRSVIASIALTRYTIGDVIARTLDVNDNVRRNAFAALAKVRFQNLKITQRITLLERGLRDRVGTSFNENPERILLFGFDRESATVRGNCFNRAVDRPC